LTLVVFRGDEIGLWWNHLNRASEPPSDLEVQNRWLPILLDA
jgi:hypothetical protein